MTCTILPVELWQTSDGTTFPALGSHDMPASGRPAICGLPSLILAASSAPHAPGLYLWEDGAGARYIVCYRGISAESEFYGSFYYLGSLTGDFIAVADLSLTYKSMFAKESARLATLPSLV